MRMMVCCRWVNEDHAFNSKACNFLESFHLRVMPLFAWLLAFLILIDLIRLVGRMIDYFVRISVGSCSL